MKNAILFTIPFLLSSAFASAAPQLIDSCYVGADTDADQSVKVQIYSNERGLLAVIPDDKGGAEWIPVVANHDRVGASWIYSTAKNAEGITIAGFSLEVYKTSVKPRTPTGLNAHLSIWKTGGVSIQADRMECVAL